MLAPEGNPNSPLASNPTHNPNLGLNNPAFFQPGNSNLSYDFSGDGKFEQSALYAASQLAYNGPVVVVAEAGLPSRSPITGLVTQASFSLVAPAGNTTGSGGSASVPYNTMLVFQAGSALKLQGSSLFVQDQGSALQAQGTRREPGHLHVVQRRLRRRRHQQQPRHARRTPATGAASSSATTTTRIASPAAAVPGRRHPRRARTARAAISGEQDAMSILNFATIRYAGGGVPQGSSTFYSGITLYNARPMITNDNISNTGGTGGTEGAIGADMDSLREDDTARGPLIRNDTSTGNSLNGLYLMAETNGFIEPTNAMTYPTNPTDAGRIAQLHARRAAPRHHRRPSSSSARSCWRTPAARRSYVTNRLYIQPGSMIKFNKGSGLDVINPAASLNVGSRSYINGFDQNTNYSPNVARLRRGRAERSRGAVHVDLRRHGDDPVRPGDQRDRRGDDPDPRASACGAASGSSPAPSSSSTTPPSSTAAARSTPRLHARLAVGPGVHHGIATPSFPIYRRLEPRRTGTHAYITNNNFYNNFDAAMQIEPNGLLAGDPLTPLDSGHPFFRGNVMQGNGIDGLSVRDRAAVYLDNADHQLELHRPDRGDPGHGMHQQSGYVNQTVNAVWDSTDLTYVLRGTVVLGPEDYGFFGLNGTSNGLPIPEHDGLHDRAVADRHADDPGGAARHPARQRRDDPQPRPVGHRQDAQRQDAARTPAH